MKRAIVPAFAGFVLLFCLTFLSAFARAGDVTLTASAILVRIEGGSTLHAWQASAGSATVTALVDAGGAGLLGGLSKDGLKKLDLVLSVDSLKSTEGSGMDKNTHLALQSDKFPTIGFSLGSYHLDGMTVTAKGALSIHGQTRSVSLTGFLVAKDGGLALSGSYPLLMSDYGIKPPVMMFGAIKVDDKVEIAYSFKLPD